MTEDCACLREFPPRDFKSASQADDFMSKVRLSPVFRFLAVDSGDVTRERYRCRTCARDWLCRIPAEPPYTWGPAVPLKEAKPAAEQERIPLASPAFLEVGGLKRDSLGWATVVYEIEASDDVSAVVQALLDWRPGLQSWSLNAGLKEIEIQVGAKLLKGSPVFTVFAEFWPRGQVNPAWKAMKAGKNWRPVHLRGIRSREGAMGFQGEYYLAVVDLKSEAVMAWMMMEAR